MYSDTAHDRWLESQEAQYFAELEQQEIEEEDCSED